MSLTTLQDIYGGLAQCSCDPRQFSSASKKVLAITGGPCSGKTTFLQMAKRIYCKHVALIPEAATILYSGGFPRTREPEVIKAAQRSIWFLITELERIALENPGFYALVCDRGTLDGPAYWPGDAQSFLDSLRTTREKEFARYGCVLHLCSAQQSGYMDTQTRTETQLEALALDRKTYDAWKGHPNHIEVPGEQDFLKKMKKVEMLVSSFIQSKHL